MIEYENLKNVNNCFVEEFQKKISSILDKGWYILGNTLKEFGLEFAQYLKVNYCIGVASGLDALTLSLKALKLEKDDEVIVPSNTYIATILSILHCGLKPILVEPDIHTYNIDPMKIEGKITKKTKVLMVVHLYGKSADMNPILEIKKKHNLLLVEDCAQSHGAKYFEN